MADLAVGWVGLEPPYLCQICEASPKPPLEIFDMDEEDEMRLKVEDDAAAATWASRMHGPLQVLSSPLLKAGILAQ